MRLEQLSDRTYIKGFTVASHDPLRIGDGTKESTSVDDEVASVRIEEVVSGDDGQRDAGSELVRILFIILEEIPNR